MDVRAFLDIIDSKFYTGVPDSQLKSLCDYLIDCYGIDKHHIIAANEGNSVAIAAGYYLATGKIPVVYLQNSGEGNVINPIASLLNDRVYAIPMIFIIGWRGEPGINDEPQHIYQGEVTVKLLDDMDVASFIVGKETTEEDVSHVMGKFKHYLKQGKQVAFVIRKNTLSYDGKRFYTNEYSMNREEIIKHIIKVSDDDPVISTTGKASRELFEAREGFMQDHKRDFLTVGSMGHGSSIALGIALNQPEKKIWCIDGDGAVLMHMGALAVIGANKPKNFIHIVINNGSHETVGGMPTVAKNINLSLVAKSCGYKNSIRVENYDELDKALIKAKEIDEICFLEVMSSIESRADLGRPTTTALDNKKSFMEFLSDGVEKI